MKDPEYKIGDVVIVIKPIEVVKFKQEVIVAAQWTEAEASEFSSWNYQTAESGWCGNRIIKKVN